MSFTNESTILPNAPPMMTPTAKSIRIRKRYLTENERKRNRDK